MKRTRRTALALVLTAAFLLTGVPALASAEPADSGLPYVEDVGLYQDAWYTVDSSRQVGKLTVGPGCYVAPAEGYALLMIADGQVVDPTAEGVYENVTLRVAPADYTYGIYDETGNAEGHSYRFLFNTGAEAVQVDEALAGAAVSQYGEYTLVDGMGGVINVLDSGVNAISAEDGKVIFRNMDVNVTGTGICEFGNAFGAAFSVAGDSDVLLQNVHVTTEGAIMSALNSAQGDVLVMDSSFHGYGTAGDASGLHSGMASYSNVQGSLTEVPWVLGLRGTLRTTNVIGTGNVIYYNDEATSNGWGVYSTDGGSSVIILNSKASYDDSRGAAFESLYGAYVMSLPAHFYGFDVDLTGAEQNTYGIVARGSFTMGASSQANLAALDKLITEPEPADDASEEPSGEASGSGEMPGIESAAGAWSLFQTAVGAENVPERRSTIKARYGVMSHGANGAVFDITCTDITAADAAFLLKDAYDIIHLDGTDTVTAPIIIHQQLSDDASMGEYAYDHCWAAATPVFLYDVADTGAAPTKGASAVMTGMTLTGDFYNTDTNGAYLDLTFDGTAVTGVISSARFTHDNASYFVVENPAFDPAAAESNENLRYICVDGDGAAYETELTHTLFGGNVYNPVYTDDNGIVTFARADGVQYAPADIVGYSIFYTDASYCSDGQIDPCAAVNDPVYVTLTGGSVWSVTGDSHLARLTVDPGCTINGLVSVDGAAVDVSAGGTWEGDILVSADPYGISTMPASEEIYVKLDDILSILTNG